jgi:curved DNA-binding protein CbpA
LIFFWSKTKNLKKSVPLQKIVDFETLLYWFHIKRQEVTLFMKKIVEYRKLLNVDRTAELKDLKTIYRNAMKEAHPDKFQGNDAGLKEAEENSKKIIEAYHFLVSINPETVKQNLPEYTETIATSTISDYKFVEGRLIINFSNGSVYEYISVPKATYVKMVNADSPGRFAKRHILNSFTWRKTINQD